MNSRWIKDLNLRPETIALLEENVGEILQDIGAGDDFLKKTSKAQAAKAELNKWTYVKLRSFHTAKEKMKSEETTKRIGKNICKLPDKGLTEYQQLKQQQQK